jgi:adenosylmethionine-8-amino-7-oxononanoate aminotransferase
MILFGPPFIINRAQIDEMIDIIDETLSVVEQRLGD